ncbi:MAG: hypothetical protein M3Z23_09925 [Acidobacteriota bacterium]|nr:hypothetical protein [Acidobacteriota bacterium]
MEEKISVGGSPVYTRNMGQVHLAGAGKQNDANFVIDWHLVALPIIQQQSTEDSLGVFKRMLILRPMPRLILGDSAKEIIPAPLIDKVFILGVFTEPERLKNDLGSFETISLALAQDCRENTSKVRGHHLLLHNKNELDRLSKQIRTLLFP